MPSALMKFVGRCFPSLLNNNHVRSIRHVDGLYVDQFNFIVPRKEFYSFEAIKPEDGAFLTVSQYMFLYKYLTSGGHCEEPAPDYERVYYFFRGDNSSMFLLKGWVPTVSYEEQGCIPERKLLANLNKKIQLLRASGNDVYVKEKNTNATYSNKYSQTSEQSSRPASEFELQSESRMIPSMVFSGPPPLKSTYNWGIINTWSRHMAPESDDSAPVDIFNRMRYTAVQSISNINQMEALDVDIINVIEGRSKHGKHVPKRPCRSDGMVSSTLDTRDRSVRPHAAKGSRKPSVERDT